MSVVRAPRAAPAALPPALARAVTALEDDGWRVLHQLRWPGRLKDPIDHVLVGRGGVLVVSVVDGTTAGRRTTERELRAAAAAGAAVASLLHAEHHDAVRAVLCVPGADLNGLDGAVGPGVVVLAAADLHRWASGLPARLDDDDEVRSLAEHLRWQLGDPAEQVDDAAGVVPLTRRALREAERRADRRRRRSGLGVLSGLVRQRLP